MGAGSAVVKKEENTDYHKNPTDKEPLNSYHNCQKIGSLVLLQIKEDNSYFSTKTYMLRPLIRTVSIRKF